ncbi:ribosome-associated protein [Vogesella indigofera]|uniref:Dual-action ribosomal maturation protein DarP n=1 Tax=Vogesella indigofera TaxID=45465 RepID=A0A495BJH8_VOGIN|nr:ribosome biogenesis factor YjgA [Vogesella indigofera]RKQ61278.1 ribosome-associated protein [Vogesella indigofera]
MPEYHNDGADALPASKSQRKRDMDALQDIGRALTELPAAKLKKMNLDDGLLVALLDFQKITANGAKRRQLQYIGKLMRDIDPEPIEQQLAALRGDSSAHTRWLHLLERWRERLVEDDSHVQQLINDFPQLDVQQLRTMVRNARKEREENKPPKANRQLFQLLKELIPEQGKPANSGDEQDDTQDE